MIANPTHENITADFVERYGSMGWEILALAVVKHQAYTKRGAVMIVDVPEKGVAASFYSTEFRFSQHGFDLLEFEGPERANETFRDLCRRYWAGFPTDTGPTRELEVY